MANSSALETARGDDELRALARLTFDELARGVGGIGQIHEAIANRVFTHVGARGVVARAAHDAISAGVYAGLGACTSALGPVAARALAARGHARNARYHIPRWAAGWWA